MSKKHTHPTMGAVRIISGRWRGSKLPVPNLPGLRPTSDRARETLFNWLAPWLPGAICVDLYAGTGVLGLEAASRGAGAVVLVDSNAVAVNQMQDTVRRLNADAVTVIRTSARQFLESTEDKFDITFVDPPFQDYAADTVSALLSEGVDAVTQAGGWVYLEHPRALAEVNTPEGWRLHREKSLGEVSIKLFRVRE